MHFKPQQAGFRKRSIARRCKKRRAMLRGYSLKYCYLLLAVDQVRSKPAQSGTSRIVCHCS